MGGSAQRRLPGAWAARSAPALGTTCGQGGMRPGFVTSPGIYRELIGLEQFGRRGPDGDVRFSQKRLFFQRGR